MYLSLLLCLVLLLFLPLLLFLRLDTKLTSIFGDSRLLFDRDRHALLLLRLRLNLVHGLEFLVCVDHFGRPLLFLALLPLVAFESRHQPAKLVDKVVNDGVLAPIIVFLGDSWCCRWRGGR